MNSTGVSCGQCSQLQPLPSPLPSFFEVFGLEPSLELNDSFLRSQFYALSQQVHPDTHVQKEPVEQMKAAQWSTFINRAYQTLRDPQLRLDYLLDLYPTQNKSSGSVPSHLAEAYFELQEALMEDTDSAALNKFREQLKTEQDRYQKELQQLSIEWNKTEDKNLLVAKLNDLNHRSKYLASLNQDLKKRWGHL